ncbi:MAG: hypothetical protein JW731_12220 [Bacteroidales bacterium]|nr:hypothetical protein [Bacteroidales bacterium]
MKETALDTERKGFNTYVIKNAIQAVNNKPGSKKKAIEEMRKN